MKKLLLILLAMALFVAPAFAAPKNLNVFWTQVLPSPNDMMEWGLWQSSTPGGPYTKILSIPATTAVNPEYTASTTITVPDNATTVLYFVLDAADTYGNRSPKSNELSVTVDAQAPNAPVQLRIVIISADGTIK